jgi:hypothetical protein
MQKNILILSACLALGLSASKTEEVTYIGQAKLGGNNIYTEKHHEFYENNKHTYTVTDYLNSTGKVIVNRKADFSKNRIGPDYELKDLRNGHYENVKQVSPTSYHIIYKKNQNESTREKTVELPKGTVIESGINYLVKDRWSEIQQGKTISFNFAVAARLTYYGFNLTSQGECLVNGLKVVRIKMEPDNFLLQKMVDPIVMCFDPKTKRMVSYEGISNIRDDNSHTMVVKILYPELGP